MDIDWRIQAMATTAMELPAAYPGGPAHPPGSTVVLVSQVTPAEGMPITFPVPSASALALGIAARAARAAAELRNELRFGTAVAPSGRVLTLSGAVTSHLFDYFEHCFVAVVFSIQALEAYCNYKISYTLKSNLTVERRGQEVVLSPLEAERELSTDEKLGGALPQLLRVPSPRGRTEWEAYVHLRRLRDATVHIKSHHQWSSSGEFEESPYAWFMQRSALTIPQPAIQLLRYFAADHEQRWLEGAERLLRT